jgi:hypothetical protein
MAKKKGEPSDECIAVQASNAEAGKHAVGILNLDVAIVPDGRFWYAQALQIDYGAQGTSVQDAKSQFEAGLRATLHHNIRMFGTIAKLLRVTPMEVWMDLMQTAKSQHKVYSQVSFHEIIKDIPDDVLPFETITYTEVHSAA